MHFSTALHKGTLLKRYKRFLADVKLSDGTIVTAHCPNTGSMESCYQEGSIIWMTHSSDPNRKLAWTWELTEIEDGFIGINTARPNQVVFEGIKEGLIPQLAGYDSARREVKYGKNSRIDVLLESKDKPECYVEIKNTTLRRGQQILFPDAVTERGRKHLEELVAVKKAGKRAVMVFLVNRPDGTEFSPADSIDPDYGLALRAAVKAGVEVIALRCINTTTEMKIGNPVPLNFKG